MRTCIVGVLSVLVLIGLGLSSAGAEDPLPVKVTRLTDKAIVLSTDRGHANQLALSSEKGIVVFNTLWSNSAASEYRAIIEREFGRDDFAYVILTGARLIRFGGNAVYPGAQIIAHESTFEDISDKVVNLDGELAREVRIFRQKVEEHEEDLENEEPNSDWAAFWADRIVVFARIARDLAGGLDPVLPTRTFSDRLTLDLGDMTLDLFYFGNRTITAYAPEERVVMAGDAFHPVHVTMTTLRPGTPQDVPRWLQVLDPLLDDEDDVKHVVCPWRGIWPREELLWRRDYIRQLWEDVKEATADGISFEEARERLSLDHRYTYLKDWVLWERQGPEWVTQDHLRNLRAFWGEFHESAAGVLQSMLETSDPHRAWEQFRSMRADKKNRYTFSESEFNSLGYRLMGEEKIDAAIAIFRMNVEMFPESWNAYDSLGEAYVKAGQKDLAVWNYEKSLELNPENENGLWQLRWMDGQIYTAQNETREEFRYSPGEQTGLKGPYFGEKPPGRIPEVFAPGIVSSRGGFEFCASFTPDGKEFYFNRGPDICVSRLEKDGWTAPEPASFNAPDLDHEAHATADGKKLFFGTRRIRPGEDSPDYGIWFMERTDDGWGEPQYHGPGMYVTTSRNRNLYVTDTSVEPSAIVMQEWVDGRYAPPVRLEGGVNSGYGEAHPCIAPDEGFIIFDSRRPGSLGGEWDDDLYVSFRNPDGTWGEAIHLGSSINTPGNNMTASLSPDAKYLFYFCNDDVYWVDAAVIESFRP